MRLGKNIIQQPDVSANATNVVPPSSDDARIRQMIAEGVQAEVGKVNALTGATTQRETDRQRLEAIAKGSGPYAAKLTQFLNEDGAGETAAGEALEKNEVQQAHNLISHHGYFSKVRMLLARAGMGFVNAAKATFVSPFQWAGRKVVNTGIRAENTWEALKHGPISTGVQYMFKPSSYIKAGGGGHGH